MRKQKAVGPANVGSDEAAHRLVQVGNRTLHPGKAKTKGSKAPVAVPDVLMPLLKTWRHESQNAPDGALIFPSEKGRPMRPEN